jgi:hypothetical protein
MILKLFLSACSVDTKTEEVSLADLGGEAAKFHKPGKTTILWASSLVFAGLQ